MFIEAKDDAGGDNWTTGAISRARLQSNHHHKQTNIQLFIQAGCPSCRPTNCVKALKGKISHSMHLLTPSSPGSLPTLSRTINSSWLSWRRVAMPLISPLMPVPLLLVVWWLFTVYYFVQYRYSVWICNVSVSTYVHYASVTLSFPFS